jgi:hypothetical protein
MKFIIVFFITLIFNCYAQDSLNLIPNDNNAIYVHLKIEQDSLEISVEGKSAIEINYEETKYRTGSGGRIGLSNLKKSVIAIDNIKFVNSIANCVSRLKIWKAPLGEYSFLIIFTKKKPSIIRVFRNEILDHKN